MYSLAPSRLASSSLLVALLAASAACRSERAPAPSAQAATTPKAAALRNGLPLFATLDEAFAFAGDERNMAQFTGVIFGSEHFSVELPSGETQSNWFINAYFRDIFRPFGAEAYPYLAPHLEHSDLFVQVGAAAVLSAPMSRLGFRFHMDDTAEERHATVVGLVRAL